MPSSSLELPIKTIAAIDIGTNSAHLVVAEMDHIGEMRILDNDKVTLRLGQAINIEGNLSDDGIQRTIETLKHMQEISNSYHAIIRAVATHATREARNHKKLLDLVQKAAGIKIELIDGIEEARLVFLGMRYGLSLNGIPCLGVDIGGGSTEIIIAKDDDISYVSSVKLGAVTLTDRYLGPKTKPSADHIKSLIDNIKSRLAPIQQEARRFKFEQAIASSGTAKALAYMHAKLFGGGDMSDPNGYVIPREDLFSLVKELHTLLTPEKIRDFVNIDESRAEIIIAGATILQELTRLFNVKEWIVTSYGLREGLVADTFHRAYGRKLGAMADIQWHSVLQFAKRLRINEAHARQVKKLTLRLFDQLAPQLRSEYNKESLETDRKLLKAAAYLREAGKFLSAPQYQKHSAYLISNSRLPGFTESERSMMGLIARFQRKGIPSAGNKHCEDLSTAEIKRLRLLAAIVRLAAALDRSRQNRVKNVKAEATKDAITITIHHEPHSLPDVEIHKAKLEREALEKSFGRKVNFLLQPCAEKD